MCVLHVRHKRAVPLYFITYWSVSEATEFLSSPTHVPGLQEVSMLALVAYFECMERDSHTCVAGSRRAIGLVPAV